ncbi:MAG: dTDP-4-dehydrorhamnose reductase [Treponematales bacterium]
MEGRVWLIGHKGMLGRELALLMESCGRPFTGTGREVDITNPAALAAFAEAAGRDGPPVRWVINAAAYTAVDKAEDEEAPCRAVNALGPAHIAAAARTLNAPLLHLSTDYVFNGLSSRPYREDDAPSPAGVYARTKLEGERAVLASGVPAYIVRTAWLYGAHGGNFVRTMLALMNSRDEVKVVDDQRGSPTWAACLARALLRFIERSEAGSPAPSGVYHFAGGGETTWFGFAREIYERGRRLGLVKRECAVTPCATADYPSKARRPARSTLDTRKIRAALGMDIPPWQESLEQFLRREAGKGS